MAISTKMIEIARAAGTTQYDSRCLRLVRWRKGYALPPPVAAAELGLGTVFLR